MKTEKEMLEYIGKRIEENRKKYDKSRSRLQKERAQVVLQEYYELLEYYKN